MGVRSTCLAVCCGDAIALQPTPCPASVRFFNPGAKGLERRRSIDRDGDEGGAIIGMEGKNKVANVACARAGGLDDEGGFVRLFDPVPPAINGFHAGKDIDAGGCAGFDEFSRDQAGGRLVGRCRIEKDDVRHIASLSRAFYLKAQSEFHAVDRNGDAHA